VVHPSGKKAVDGVLWRFDNGFAFDIEGRVQKYWHHGDRLEILEQPIQTLVVFSPNGLHARCAIDVHDGRNLVSPLGSHALGEQHEWRFRVTLENFASLLGKHGWRERPECL